MSDTMKQLLEEQEDLYQEIYRGEVVEGTVILEKPDCWYVDLSYKTDGILNKSEVNNEDDIKVGDRIEVFVSKIDKNTGEILLSKKKVDEFKAWEDIKVGDILNVKAIEYNTKGLITTYKGNIRGFMPFSQLELRYVSQDVGKNYLGQEFEAEVLDIVPKKRRLILSRKSILQKNQDELKNQTIQNIQEGAVFTGEIIDIKDYGLFVDIGGIVGLVHISEVSWDRHLKVSKEYAVGQKVQVSVLSFNPENERLSLSIKRLEKHPWDVFVENHKVGDILDGEVKNIKDYGAFINLCPAVDGFIHISNLSDTFIKNPADILKIGSKVKVKLINIDNDSKKLELSMLLNAPSDADEDHSETDNESAENN